MAKVSDLFQLPIFKDIRMIAGSEGLNRKVEYVTVMEVPDIKRWLKGNDFLITSLYSVRKSEKEQCDLIRELSDTCCCIAVKTGEYVDIIPESVKEIANRYALPILEIPRHITYIDLIIQVMNLIFEEEGSSVILEKYIKDILYENYSDEILMAERGRLFGFDVENNYFAAVNISFRKAYSPTKHEKKKLRFLCQSVKQFIKSSPNIRECHTVPFENSYVLFLESENENYLKRLLHAQITEQLFEKLWNGEIETLILGIGPVLPGMLGIRDSYSATFKAARVGQKLKSDQFVFFYDKMSTFCELEDFFSGGKGQNFAKVLDELQNQEMLDTLITYFESNNSIDETADKMFVHKNTVKYRLNRLQELTGLYLKNPDDNFQLYLAVLAKKLQK